jgi:hypothetical protein
VDVQDGLFSTALGDGTALDTSLFDGRALWLGVAVGADAEATPRQQILPVAYALSLVPGAQVTGEDDGQPALTLNHTGEGNALRGITSSTSPSRTAVIGINNGTGWGVAGLANSDEVAGVGGMNEGAGPGVLGESIDGPGGYFTSTNTYGLRAETGATDAGMSAVLGVAEGWAAHDLPYPAGVLGKSATSFGVAGVSDSFVGTMGRSETYYGVWGESHGTFAGVWGASWGGGFGVYGYSDQNHGVRGQGNGDSGDYGGYFTGGGGVYGRGVDHGGYFTSTAGYGVQAESYTGRGVYGNASATTGWVIGVMGVTASEGGDGVYGYALSATGSGYGLNGVTASESGVGVRGYAAPASGGRIGVLGEVNGTGYGLYTTDNLYVGGTCTGCTLAQIARNTGQETLRVGDVVAVSGVGPVLAEHSAPVLQVRQATASDVSVLGVVYSRGEFYAASGEERASGDSVQPVAGDVAPGDYLLVVTSGLAQVRVAPDSYAPGQKLTAGEATGLATLAGLDANPDLVFARAMEAKPNEDGLLWALVSVQ